MMTYKQQSVKCGKPTCRHCPHGPYWYGFWSERGRTKSIYIGKVLPQEKDYKQPSCIGNRHWLRILGGRGNHRLLAFEILGIDENTCRQVAFKQAKNLRYFFAAKYPDDALLLECLKEAWAIVAVMNDWE